MSPRTGRPLTGLKVGVFGKGGSGKSTVAVFLARVLRWRGYDVCLLDADSTNVGLHRALGIDERPASLLDHFGGMVFSGGRVTCPVDDPTPLEGARLELDGIPERYVARSPEGIRLLVGGKIGEEGPGAGCDGPIAKIARDVELAGPTGDVVTVVDFKAGFEDSARGVLATLDFALAIVDPTTAGVRMAVDLVEMVRRIQRGEPPATEHLETEELVATARKLFREARIEDALVVLNRVSGEEMEGYLRDRLGTDGIEPAAVLHDDPRIPEAWLRGMPLEDGDAIEELEPLVDRLEAEAPGPALPAGA